jgi:hypothetical protein
MKGTIVKCLQELVTEQFGKDTWQQSLEDAGIRRNTMFLTITDVDDATVMNVIQAVCRNVGITLEQAADAFGDYWVNVYSQKLYAQFYANHTTAKDFLLDMDKLHLSMTKTMPTAHPPRFRYEWSQENTLIIHYQSHRGLIDFVVGLAKGVGTFYQETLNVSKIGPDKVRVVFQK